MVPPSKTSPSSPTHSETPDGSLERLEKVIQESLQTQGYGAQSEAVQQQVDSDVLKLELITYVQQMSHELSVMAKRSNLNVLSYFLEMAAAEARDAGNSLGQKIYAGVSLGTPQAEEDKPRR